MLVVIVLLLAACNSSAWTKDEVTYLGMLTVQLENFQRAIDHPNEYSQVNAQSALGLLKYMANAPATLAVIHERRQSVVDRCQLDASLADCRNAMDALHSELANLYAARGSYPPTPTPYR